VHAGGAVEPGGVDEEHDAGDHDLAEPADDEEQRREHDPPEAELGQAERMPEVEHVPGDPEDERTEQDCRSKCGERDCDPAGDERPDPEDPQHDSQDRVHACSLRGRSAATDGFVVRGLARASRDG